jgi:transcriptional regulator with XRE-family HTH domain
MHAMRHNLLRKGIQESPIEQAETAVGERIMRLRESMGMTRTQLAARVGISDGGLRHLEISLTATPSFAVGLRLAEELKVHPRYLLTGQGASTVVVDPATAIVVPELTVAQLASLIAQAHDMIAELGRGAAAFAEGAEACVQSPHFGPPLAESKPLRKKAS